MYVNFRGQLLKKENGTFSFKTHELCFILLHIRVNAYNGLVQAIRNDSARASVFARRGRLSA